MSNEQKEKPRVRRQEYEQVSNVDDNAVDEKEDFLVRLRSKWDSRIFDVEPIPNNSFPLSHYFYPNIDRCTIFLVIPIFIFSAIISLVLIIVTAVGEIDHIVGLLVICALSVFVALFGMCGLYHWGTVEHCIEAMGQQNKSYESEIDQLSDIKDRVKSEAKKVFFTVSQLKSHSDELQQHLKSYDNLRKQLENICGDSEELNAMLNEIIEQCNDMRIQILNNKKAHLIATFYDVALKDGETGMSQKEYEYFLGRLPKAMRSEFETKAGFEQIDRNEDGVVDIIEFQEIISNILTEIDEEEMKILKNS